MAQMIYADNAATTKLDPDAFEAMRPFLLDQYGNASQPYSFSRSAKTALKEARGKIAECIHADPDEIYFTSGGTESNNWAIKGCMAYGDHRATITSAFEHHAILNTCKRIETFGYPVAYIYPTKDGFVCPENLEEIISTNTKLVSIMMVNNEIGTIQPIENLCRVAHKYGALFHTDAVQAMGHLSINVKQLGVDMLSCSAHKFNGPKGIGFLYVRKGTQLSAYADGGTQENGNRAGTENIASIVGMSVALSKNIDCLKETQQRLVSLEEVILNKLTVAGLDFIRNGGTPHIPGNLSLSFAGASGEMILHRLDLMKIMISTGSACDSKETQVSHVLDAIKISDRYARGTIRISLGRDNTVDEAEKIAAAIIKILCKN